VGPLCMSGVVCLHSAPCLASPCIRHKHFQRLRAALRAFPGDAVGTPWAEEHLPGGGRCAVGCHTFSGADAWLSACVPAGVSDTPARRTVSAALRRSPLWRRRAGGLARFFCVHRAFSVKRGLRRRHLAGVCLPANASGRARYRYFAFCHARTAHTADGSAGDAAAHYDSMYWTLDCGGMFAGTLAPLYHPTIYSPNCPAPSNVRRLDLGVCAPGAGDRGSVLYSMLNVLAFPAPR